MSLLSIWLIFYWIHINFLCTQHPLARNFAGLLPTARKPSPFVSIKSLNSCDVPSFLCWKTANNQVIIALSILFMILYNFGYSISLPRYLMLCSHWWNFLHTFIGKMGCHNCECWYNNQFAKSPALLFNCCCQSLLKWTPWWSCFCNLCRIR